MSLILINGDVLKCTAVCAEDNQVSMNTWHYWVSAAGANPITDSDVALALDTAIAAGLKGMISSSATYKGVLVQKVHPPLIQQAVQSTAGAGPGTISGGTAPKQLAGLTSWYTNLAGRHGRGRTYWPFIGTADVFTNGKPVAAYVTRADAVAAAVMNLQAITVGGKNGIIRFSIFNRTSKEIQFVTVRVTRSLFATQRKRGDFGRINTPPI